MPVVHCWIVHISPVFSELFTYISNRADQIPLRRNFGMRRASRKRESFFFKLRLTFQVETKTHTHETGTHFLHLMAFFRFVWIIFIYTSYTKYELVTRAVIVFVKEKKESAMIAPSDVLIYFPVHSIQILDSLAYTEAKNTHTHKKKENHLPSGIAYILKANYRLLTIVWNDYTRVSLPFFFFQPKMDET